MTDERKQAGASERTSPPDARADDETGGRMPTPDPKDQTGDPDADNPAMQSLRKKRSASNITES